MLCYIDGSSFTVTSYRWNTQACYTNPSVNSGNPDCFPRGHTTQSVTDYGVTAEDAGTITCTATINSSDHTSEPFTLRISGAHLWLVHMLCTIDLSIGAVT